MATITLTVVAILAVAVGLVSKSITGSNKVVRNDV
jgi:hypothetical protein